MITVLKYLLTAVELICCAMLVGVILIQRTKSQGIGVALGGAMGEQLFGTQMGNVLTKATVILGIVFLINTTILAVLGTVRREASVTDGLDTGPAPMAMPAPLQPAPGGPMPDATLPMDTPVPMDMAAPVEIPAMPMEPVADVPMADVPMVPDTVPVAPVPTE